MRRPNAAPLAVEARDTVLVYVKDPWRNHFDAEAAERLPYMAPGLVGPERPLAACAKQIVIRRIPNS